jgi:hypothetical protein
LGFFACGVGFFAASLGHFANRFPVFANSLGGFANRLGVLGNGLDGFANWLGAFDGSTVAFTSILMGVFYNRWVCSMNCVNPDGWPRPTIRVESIGLQRLSIVVSM